MSCLVSLWKPGVFINLKSVLSYYHRKYIRIDITTLGRGHGRVCLADGNSHINPFVNYVCQGKLTTSVPQTKVNISKQVFALQVLTYSVGTCYIYPYVCSVLSIQWSISKIPVGGGMWWSNVRSCIYGAKYF
jgi:hypothetical protein